MTERYDFHALARELASSSLSRDEVRTRDAMREAHQRLREAKPAITSEDVQRIVRNDMLPTHALTAVRRWATPGEDGRIRTRYRFVALIGPRGRGKTVAGAWLLARCGGTYVTAPELQRMYESRHFADRHAFDRLLRVRLLIVDELGIEDGGEKFDQLLYEIVNTRQAAPALTLKLSNLTRADFTARYFHERAGRTADRFERYGKVIEIGGPDLRKGHEV